MRQEMIEAVNTLTALRRGDAVTVTLNGRVREMTVSQEARRSDGAYGSYESTHVIVTFGPGRFSTEARAESIVAGQQSIVKTGA